DTSLLRDLINEQRSNFIITKIVSSSNTLDQNIFSSHIFFELLDKNLEKLDQPSATEMYGKKHEQISNLITTSQSQEDFAADVKKLIEQTYIDQSSSTKGSKK
ncbi:MAG TPA: hypothetical protein PLT55_03130, partial [Acidimicrobiia bacterium]|nr:hypothetical protein [Acidimicrobiia bacterium]